MSSPITLSGFNNIDFNVILNAVMTQESQPLQTMQTQQNTLKSQSSAFSTLATKMAALESAAKALTGDDAFGGRSVTVTDTAALTASAGSTALPGTYDVVVQELARAQVTAAASIHDDRDTTIVATGGTITIGGVAVTITGDVTLEGLVNSINTTADIPVTASIVSPSSGHYQMVLTGKDTGESHAFTIVNALAGSTVAFTDTDLDGTSGDSPEDNAVQALDARALVNNIVVTSETNVFDGAIPGTTLTVRKKDPAATVTVSIDNNPKSTTTLVQTFVNAYNDLAKFAESQTTSGGAIAHDAMFRTLRNELRSTVGASYGDDEDTGALAMIGVGFDRTGRLTLDSAKLEAAVLSSPDEVRALFVGDGTTDNAGVFGTVAPMTKDYTKTGGILSNTRDRLDLQVRALDDRMAAFQDRLAVRREALQRSYTATDMLISQLNSQSSSLSSIGKEYRLF